MDPIQLIGVLLVLQSLIISINGGVSFLDLQPSVGESSNPKLNVGPALRCATNKPNSKPLYPFKKDRMFYTLKNYTSLFKMF